jgi:uncharacterized protein (DUF885 family)
MRPIHMLLAGALAFAPAGQAAVQQPAAAQSAHDRLFALFAASDEAELRRNPLDALGRGDRRYADQFGDYLSPARSAADLADAQANLRALGGIDRERLSAEDRIAYDVFRYRQEQEVKSHASAIERFARLLPMSQQGGYQIGYPRLVSGSGSIPFETLADYEAGLKRIPGFVAYIDEAIALMREGIAAGIVQPRPIAEAMLKPVGKIIAQPPAESTFLGPVRDFPDAVRPADRARLTAAYTSALQEQILPAYRRLAAFLQREYVPAARASIGLSALPGGAAYYAWRIEQNTTLPLSADELHQLGLKEVARNRAEMEAIRRQVGFAGDLKAFFEHLRTDPRFKVKSKEELAARYAAIERTVRAHVPAQFSLVPKSALEIRPIPAFAEATAPPAYYEEGTPDGSRPGVFSFNSYDLPTRTTPSMDAFFLHEGIPGHHFQISLANENTKLPNFLRFDFDTVFAEGWALYAETLWKEMGVETDPYTRFGGLNADIWRAIRLVVDTGIHAKGWSREQAIQYFLDNSGVSATDAASEVDRYIANPGQALAYKVGQLTILRLKKQAQDALGARFDPHAFHAQLLNTGSMPMPVLEKKIADWIAAGGR